MSIGFDYGTANCSVAQMVDGWASRIPLMHGVYDLPSSLSAPTSHAVSEALFRHYDIKPSSSAGETALRIAIRHNSEEGLDIYPSDFKMQDSERCHSVEFKENNAA
ncbi:chaperone [Vibrio caribbeanicus]|uniref:Putative chaperone n=1 Tax=Vibrio caribbeanicus ATCC BAA-2122 TaxID=796620 RepID=E3BJR8_9VIBR|nr:chaperone [Vibrio caribbeanicus]EFP96837.1 putative chaperone [Vibrio caribbeanicus ATCC BAA-2122]